MLRVVVVLAVLGISFGFHHDEGILKKYAFLKIMSSCIGEDTIMQLKTDMMAACERCHAQNANMTQLDFNDMMAEMRRSSQKDLVYVPYYVPVYIPYKQPQSIYVRQDTHYDPYRPQNPPAFAPNFDENNGQFPPSTSYLQPVSRTKRSLPFDFDTEKMKEAITMKVHNMTCVLREMNWLSEDNMINFTVIESMINDLDVDYELKEDLLYVNDVCKDFSMCLPVEKAKHPLVKELGQVFAYMKCKTKKAVVACMKNDVRKYKKQMVTDMRMDMGMGLDMDEVNRSSGEDDVTPDELIDQLTNLIFN
ncbi:unnamed protein product [Meganyctiphanes norvegica]|uniref:Uncharacterized protein n=1 Tax=Meganyctiphanes norvegica TaxID=48144 RepID=A0AAV2PJG5_MEGNR